ncbi:hypothetical protein SAMN05421510_10843 [Nitrosomonas ureae]|nr:hypothetical protein C8R27_1501 [Nitrosomonas ureae]SDU36757.1 hypothetical protein SAMN05216406_1741 [Nitrosomonas ureae]SEQ55980.1 hypothetical protein SAMN05421510_10843 [Nitrosomonas ureae]
MGQVFNALIIEPDWESEFIDGRYVKAHHRSVETEMLKKVA